MKPRRAVRLFLFTASLIVSACWCLTGDFDGIPQGQIPTVTPKPAQPTPLPTSTNTPEPEDDLCNFFKQLQIKVFFHDIYPEDTWMTMYFVIPGGVPGLEIDAASNREFVYTAELGDLVSKDCNFRDYPERLYCLIELPPEAHNTSLPLRVHLKDCIDPIFSHPGVSLVDEEPTQFNDIPVDDCGARPSSETCNQDFSDWCACKGGSYQCELVGGIAVREVPVCILP
jgi:hypothetical protein